MSVARVLIRQNKMLYRFIKAETTNDGSLIALLDRDPRSKIGARDMDAAGSFVPRAVSSDKPAPSFRYSIHTTGEVHYYSAGQRQNTIHIEPIYALTGLHGIGVLSIPRCGRLDPFIESKHSQDVLGILQIPDELDIRITFGMEIGPRPQSPATFGISLDYELYSLVVRVIDNVLRVPDDMPEHFVCGMLKQGAFLERQASPATAELEFYRRAHPGVPPIYREESGAYIVHAAVEMAYPPRLTVEFDRDDLHIEQTDFGSSRSPSHKVRFWILDKGGRNKKDDLRTHITQVFLEAEL